MSRLLSFPRPGRLPGLCRACLCAVAVSSSVPVLAGSGAVEYWGGAKSLMDMCAFIQAFFNITTQLLNVVAAIISFYSATQIYIKIQHGEGSFSKDVSMLIGAIVYFLVMLVVFPALFAGASGDSHGGLWGLIFG